MTTRARAAVIAAPVAIAAGFIGALQEGIGFGLFAAVLLGGGTFLGASLATTLRRRS